MAQSYVHAEASQRHFKAGTPEDYLPIHEFIDSSKRAMGDVRHRAMLHHTEGPWIAQQVFGTHITVKDKDGNDKKILVREIVESHIIEDLGWLPSLSDWQECMNCLTWMGGKRNKFIGREEMLNTMMKEGRKDADQKPA